TERVLVMSFVDGTPIDDVEPLREAGRDLEQLLRDGVRTWVGAALEHGIVHGGVHAGNLFVPPAGELTFLDFGLARRPADRPRLAGVEPLRQAGRDLAQLLRAGVRTWVAAALEHGIFHADVHAGNLFVSPAGELTFLDFGIAGRLDDRTRLILRRALPAML